MSQERSWESLSDLDPRTRFQGAFGAAVRQFASLGSCPRQAHTGAQCDLRSGVSIGHDGRDMANAGAVPMDPCPEGHVNAGGESQ
jgi:hypothetical protein